MSGCLEKPEDLVVDNFQPSFKEWACNDLGSLVDVQSAQSEWNQLSKKLAKERRSIQRPLSYRQLPYTLLRLLCTNTWF